MTAHSETATASLFEEKHNDYHSGKGKGHSMSRILSSELSVNRPPFSFVSNISSSSQDGSVVSDEENSCVSSSVYHGHDFLLSSAIKGAINGLPSVKVEGSSLHDAGASNPVKLTAAALASHSRSISLATRIGGFQNVTSTTKKDKKVVSVTDEVSPAAADPSSLVFRSSSSNSLSQLTTTSQVSSEPSPCSSSAVIMTPNLAVAAMACATRYRKGKWSKVEEEYTSKLRNYFGHGCLCGLAEGTTLRVYLSERLSCEPMRITKKFQGGSSIGKRCYPGLVIEDSVKLSRICKELDQYRERFISWELAKNRLEGIVLGPSHMTEFFESSKSMDSLKANVPEKDSKLSSSCGSANSKAVVGTTSETSRKRGLGSSKAPPEGMEKNSKAARSAPLNKDISTHNTARVVSPPLTPSMAEVGLLMGFATSASHKDLYSLSKKEGYCQSMGTTDSFTTSKRIAKQQDPLLTQWSRTYAYSSQFPDQSAGISF